MKDSKYGFRNKRSCLFNLLTYNNDLFSINEVAKSLDVDKVPCNKEIYIIRKQDMLCKSYKWITKSNRKQRVAISGAAPKRTRGISGVPQGLVFDQIRLIIYINDVYNGQNNY